MEAIVGLLRPSFVSLKNEKMTILVSNGTAEYDSIMKILLEHFITCRRGSALHCVMDSVR
jgi:hypothetical protein